MSAKTLQTVPFTINAEAIATGLLEMFDDNERVALRFGMLPATKMGVVEQTLRTRFLENATSKGGDQFTAITTDPDRRCIDFSMKRLVSEAMHEVALALYAIGDLVV